MQPSDDVGAHEPAVNGPPSSPERLALLRASLDELATESVGEATADLDLRSTSELIGLMNDGDTTVPAIVRAAAPQISTAIDAIAARMRRGGRLVYVGAGSSGRIAALDASECESTFATDPGQVVALIAGGQDAAALEQEAAEDDAEAGAAAIGELHVTPADAVVGVTASGRTPYVLGAVRAANAAGALTVGVVSVPDSALASSVDHEISVVVGPEFLAGSTRLKAGTAQKLVLNAISTITMVRLGKTYGNLMVEVVATNEKLRARVRRIVARATGAPPDEVEEALSAAGGNAKVAIVSLLARVDAGEAARRLAERGQSIRLALVE
jgi:N-acetylmuramic acid 6-phosphate etherase